MEENNIKYRLTDLEKSKLEILSLKRKLLEIDNEKIVLSIASRLNIKPEDILFINFVTGEIKLKKNEESK